MNKDSVHSAEGIASDTTSFVERLRSRQWEHRQHRKYREEAAERISELEQRLAAANKKRDDYAHERQYWANIAAATDSQNEAAGKELKKLRDVVVTAGARVAAAEKERDEAKAEYDYIMEPGRMGARYKALADLAEPAGWTMISARPVESFVRDRIEAAETALQAAREGMHELVRLKELKDTLDKTPASQRGPGWQTMLVSYEADWEATIRAIKP